VIASCAKSQSAQRFDEALKLDGRLGSSTVPVIAIPLAFRRAAPFGGRAEDVRRRLSAMRL
jgi:hypothetical protein